METINYLELSNANAMKARFKEDREIIKEHGGDESLFRDFVFEKEPQFNCPEGWKKINDAWMLRTSDFRLTELIRSYRRTAFSQSKAS